MCAFFYSILHVFELEKISIKEKLRQFYISLKIIISSVYAYYVERNKIKKHTKNEYVHIVGKKIAPYKQMKTEANIKYIVKRAPLLHKAIYGTNLSSNKHVLGCRRHIIKEHFIILYAGRRCRSDFWVCLCLCTHRALLRVFKYVYTSLSPDPTYRRVCLYIVNA